MTTLTLPHLKQKRYGSFLLTDAIRPGQDVPVIPSQGYRISRHRDFHTGKVMPVLGAAVSAEIIFDVFIELLEPLGQEVHVILETSHGLHSAEHEDLRRSHIDMSVLISHLYDFEDLLLNDGCTGVAVLSRNLRMEVQFDEHKLFFIYARDLTPFRRILRRHSVLRNNNLRLIAEAEHLHHSQLRHAEEFQVLANRLSAGDYSDHFTANDDPVW
ncbi:MAG: hypothetical protein R3B84_20080 [Zavarzinella sp.]